MQAILEDRQFYQTDLKPGKFYRLVEFRTRKNIEHPTRFQIIRRYQVGEKKSSNPVLCDALVQDAVILYVDSRFPEFQGNLLDKHRIALHRVVYGDTVGWLDGRWFLEIVEEKSS